MAKRKKVKDAYNYSIITNDLDHCFVCGRPAVQIHHVFGSFNRYHSTEDHLWIPICLECHIKVHNERSQRLNYLLKQRGQEAFEKLHDHDTFFKRYGKNYL